MKGSIFIKASLTLMLIALLLSAAESRAGNGRKLLTYGVEGSGSFIIYTDSYSTFMTEFDGLATVREAKVGCHVNGGVLAHVGINATSWMNVALYTGYEGIAPGVRGVPLSLRLSFSPCGDLCSDGPIVYADYGAVLCKNTIGKFAQVGKLGAGYRFMLSGGISLDLTAALTGSVSRPAVFDPVENQQVPNSSVYQSISGGAGLAISISLNF